MSAFSFSLFFILTASWEIYWRSRGYRPSVNDNKDLWVITREKLLEKNTGTVVIGSSRILFGFDLSVWEESFGDMPVQLSTVGTNPTFYLDDIANNTDFKGTVLLGIESGLFFVPEGNPVIIPTTNIKALKTFSYAQRWSHYIGLPLDMNLAFLEQDDLPLKKLLEELPVVQRKDVRPYPIPPMFHEVDLKRQARMTERVINDPAFAQRIVEIWKLYFTPPLPPEGVSEEVYKAAFGAHMKTVIAKAKEDIEKIRERGGKVILIQYPSTGIVKELEDKFTPREHFWDRIVAETSPDRAIHYEDYETLKNFNCPEGSHLTAKDATRFTENLVAILKN